MTAACPALRIILRCGSLLVFVANPGIAANNVSELIAEARRNPGKLNIAVAGATGEIVRITNTPEVKDRLVAAGYEVVGSSPEEFSERVKRDTGKYRKIVLDSGMQQLE